MSDLPARPPAGFRRFKAYSRKPGDNPFRSHGLREYTQTVDIEESTPLDQVEAWAREAAEEGGYQFLRLETIA